MTDLLPPPAPHFRDALKHLWDKNRMSLKIRHMLAIHYAAPDHTMTATELAKAVKYENYNAVGMHYGLLAQRVARRMRWRVKPTFASEVLFTFIKPTEDEAHWRWVMRPEVVTALSELGWRPPAKKYSSSADGDQVSHITN